MPWRGIVQKFGGIQGFLSARSLASGTSLVPGKVMIVKRAEIHVVKKSSVLFTFCDDTCFKSKNLYNHANFLIRQSLFHLDEMLWYDDVYYQVKRLETYRVLPAQTAQQTLKVLDKAWKAFYRSMMKESNVNGSYNHLRNAFPDTFNSAEGIGGCALHPVRINII